MTEAETVRLLCLPYSGASAAIYGRWRRSLPDGIDVIPVELPGRGARMAEALFTDPHRLAARLADEIEGHVIEEHVTGPGAPPYAVFGHSLGALLAFELVHALIARGAPAPRVLFVSGSEAPALRDDATFRRARSDADLIDLLRTRSGTPEEALADAELMALVLPVLRADFLMCGAYVHRARSPLPCPIQALGGRQDTVTRAGLEAWSRETLAGFDLALFEGGHFFIHEHRGAVLDCIGRRISAPLHGPMRAPGRRDATTEGAPA
ncbi:thioesterase II family protein [Methylobacterium sp. J-068]|uniref:thioesterase II family protein n=1 Tax=Methylobacterium sp. J-068 TaxID=2836649 RepID=UPI001FBB4103|nr:alpha/beta fold hydrolase [Methylobacterium sp. J-068]MCJ2036201.1 alpha/beta fold hydrolase [Methylobacterium sp. J-068]